MNSHFQPRTVLHQREIESDEDAVIVGNPEALSAIEKARPYLLFKGIVELDDTTDICDFRLETSRGRSCLVRRIC